MKSPASLFDSLATWHQAPFEAVAAWLLDPEFVLTKQGVTQPLRESSVVVYRAMLNKFIKHVVLPDEESERPGIPWSGITQDELRAFLEKNRLTKGIRNRYLRLLERLFDHLVGLHICTENPARGLAIKAPSKSGENNEKTFWLSPGQQAALVEALPDGDGWKARRNRALIALAIGGGLKPSELLVLRLGGIGEVQADGSLYIEVPRTGAGRIHRTKVEAEHATFLRVWLLERAVYALPGDIVFPATDQGGTLHPATVYRHVSAVMKEAGIDPKLVKRRGARTLRNSFALRELAAGQSLEAVGEFLGHRSDRATAAYKALLKRSV